MEINSFNPSRLKVDESFGFFKKVESLTKLLTLEADQVSVQAFTTALLAFDNVLQQNVKNTQTARVTQADKETDTIWRYFRATLVS